MADNQSYVPPNSHLVFSDEFNDNSVNRNVWNVGNSRTLPDNGEKEYYVDAEDGLGIDPLREHDGILTIEANPADPGIQDQIGGLPYTSGQITTRGTFNATYGYFEMRAQLPPGHGLWPAFWMVNEDTWPPEFDPLEAFGDRPNEVHAGVHSKSGGWGDWHAVNADITADFHTYGMLWESDQITYYFDGEPIASGQTFDDSHMPMYMIANLAVGGDWPGVPDDSTPFPAHMDIDYIRVYQQEDNNSGPIIDPDTGDPGPGPDPTPDPEPTPDPGPPAEQRGTTGDDVLVGGNGNDELRGRAGNDVLYGDGIPQSGSEPFTVKVTASGDQYQGPPEMRVYVDDQLAGDVQVTALHSNGEWKDYTFTVDGVHEAHTVKVEFVQDAWGGSADQDRNLWVQSVEINHDTLAPEEARYERAAPMNDTVDGGPVLSWAGDLAFDASGHPAKVAQGYEHDGVLWTGQDTLIGGPGDDTLHGGPDADTFVFKLNDGHDVITDFEDGVDRIRFYGYDRDEAHLTTVDGNAVIAFDDANDLTVEHITAEQLSTRELLFH